MNLSKMQVLQFTKTTYGGSGQYTLRLSDGLRNLGHRSSVVVAEGGTYKGIVNLSLNCSPVRQFANRSLLSMIRRLVSEPYHSGFRLDYWVSDRLSALPVDIVHLHGMTGWIGFEGLRRLIPKNVPVFWTAHDLWLLSGGCVVYQGCDRFQAGCNKCPILKVPFSSWSHQEWKRKAQFIKDYQIIPIANSRWVADKIEQSPLFEHFLNDDIPIIPPIVDAAFFDEDLTLSLRNTLKIPSDRTVVGLSARALTDTYKGIPEFIQRFSQEKDLASSCTLLLCGDGQLDVPNGVDCRFLGALTSTQSLAQFYKSCDVFVSPSRMETFGMTLLEAQSTGTPVVVFRVGGTPEALCPKHHRYLASSGDDSDLMLKMRELLTDLKDTDKHIGTEARNWVRSNFSSRAVSSRQAHVYEQAINALAFREV